jgi:hypothetical protein
VFSCNQLCADHSWTGEVLIMSPRGAFLRLGDPPNTTAGEPPNDPDWAFPAALTGLASGESVDDLMSADDNSPFKFRIVDPTTPGVEPPHAASTGFSHGIRHATSGERLISIEHKDRLNADSVTTSVAEFTAASRTFLCSNRCSRAGNVRIRPRLARGLPQAPASLSQRQLTLCFVDRAALPTG